MTEDMERVATFDSEVSAEICAGMLRNEGVPAEVRAISPIPGLVNEVRVYVLASLAHRARQLIDSSKLSDEELRIAAISEPREDDE